MSGAEAPSRRSGWRRAGVLAVVFLAVFLALIAITFPDGRKTHYEGLPATAALDVARPRFEGRDSLYYMEVGRDLGIDHAVPAEHYWLVNFWPPGMALFYGTLFAIFGSGMPLGIVTGIALAGLWAAALTLWADLLVRYLPVWVVALAITAVLLADVTQDWIFGLGLFWSEGIYTWTMLLALYAAVRVAIARSRRAGFAWAAGVGVALGASAYVRTTSELLARVLTVLVIVWAVGALARRGLRYFRTRRGRELAPLHSWNQQLLALALCMVAFHAVTVPWRIIAAQRMRPDNYSWSIVTNLYWHQQWTPDRILLDRKHYFLLAGGGNTACKVDPKKCREIAKVELRHPGYYTGHGYYSEPQFRQFAVNTFKAHPVDWVQRRLDLLPGAWLAPAVQVSGEYRPASDFLPVVGPEADSHELLQNGLLLAVLAGALALSIGRILRSGPDLLALLVPGLLAAVLAPGLALQWDGRYFYPIKILSIFAFAALLGLELRGRDTRDPSVPAVEPRGEAPAR